MRIAIIGAGGVGGYFGGRLAQAGNEVTLVARGLHGETIKKNGLVIESPKGNATITNVHIVSSISELRNPELILLGVKAWQVKSVAKDIKSVLGESTVIIPLQNGVLAAQELISEIPLHHVFGGLCNIFSKIKEPGVIQHMSAEPTITFGELDNAISERSVNIQHVFNDAGINNKLSSYIQGDTWKKFLLICLGGLGALTRADYGVLLATPELRNMLVIMLQEMYDLALAEGIQLNKSIVDKTMQVMDNFAPDSNSSMARDIWSGNPSELEYQNGTVVKLAHKHNLQVPTNFFIYHTLLPTENKARV